VATGPITAPVTVAFGSRDLLLRPGSRRLGQLPPHTRSATLPGCGHLPMADDPAAVAALITRTALSADQADQADQAVPQADRDAVA
jgi:pimeloyl-ACP methyl ester carboxylesterase